MRPGMICNCGQLVATLWQPASPGRIHDIIKGIYASLSHLMQEDFGKVVWDAIDSPTHEW